MKITPLFRTTQHQTAMGSFSIVYWYIILWGVVSGILISLFGEGIAGPAIAVACFAPLYWKLDRDLFPGLFIGPMMMAYLFHILGYSLGPVWQYYIIGYVEPIEEGFIPAQWGAVIGLATYAISFRLFFLYGKKFKLQRLDSSLIDISKWPTYGILMLVTGVGIIFFGFLTGVVNRLAGVSESIQIASFVNLFSSFGIVMFFFLGYAASKKRGIYWILWIMSFVFYSVFTILDGARGKFVYSALISAIGLVWGGYSVKKLIFAGVVMLLIFIPLTDIVVIYRDNYGYLPTTTSFIDRYKYFLEASNEFIYFRAKSLAWTTEKFASAVTADSVDRVFLLTPERIGYAGLENIGNIIYVFIPDILLPNRPVVVDGNELAILYGAARPGTTGSYMPAVGEGYRRGGWVGIICIYILSGAIYGLTSSICWSRRDKRIWMAMLIFIVSQAPGVFSATLLSSFYTLLWVFPRNFVVFWFLGMIQDNFGSVFKEKTI